MDSTGYFYGALPLSFKKLVHLPEFTFFVTTLSGSEFLDLNSNLLYLAMVAICNPKLLPGDRLFSERLI